ncbi:hypothetical protein FGO68_gene2161 [Halteria grandinella]|uniref:Lysozyme n=1 Tax=Halteria grandinella TaxID=5974 RepID=A0A8J8SYR0_HALGN|nr:hypothetical protein FGO68_gene2161 [Halteria grandinella]
MVERIPTFSDTNSMIKHLEGYRETTYQCQGGVKTIGYGHTGQDVKDGMTITKEQAEKLFLQDLKECQGYVGRTFQSIPLKENQIGSLVSFCFNLGQGNMDKSTLKRRMLGGEDPNTVTREEFPRWNKVKGKESTGLTRRRSIEVAHFCK